MRKNIFALLAGMVLGAALFGTAAAANYLTATRSVCPIYVDGQKVELEAYEINGYNYIKLRDVGQAVGFNVYWDGSAAQVESDKPYTGEPPAKEEAMVPEGQDHSVKPNPSIFTDGLTTESYNAFRETIINHDIILAGTQNPVKMGAEVKRNDSLENALASISRYPIYELLYQTDGYICNTRYPEAYQAAAQHTQSFIDGLAGMSDRAKVEQMVWYVADRLTYGIAYPGPGTVLSRDTVTTGCCMAYAYSFQFLCNRANIPCILATSETHQWNMVYVGGQWWDVDVGAADASDPQMREYVRLLTPPSERQGSEYIDQDPAATRLAQELLVPGSSK